MIAWVTMAGISNWIVAMHWYEGVPGWSFNPDVLKTKLVQSTVINDGSTEENRNEKEQSDHACLGLATHLVLLPRLVSSLPY